MNINTVRLVLIEVITGLVVMYVKRLMVGVLFKCTHVILLSLDVTHYCSSDNNIFSIILTYVVRDLCVDIRIVLVVILIYVLLLATLQFSNGYPA